MQHRNFALRNCLCFDSVGQGGCVELRDLQLSGCEKITDNVLIELGSCQQPPGSAPPEIYEKAQRIDMFRFVICVHACLFSSCLSLTHNNLNGVYCANISEEDNRWFPGKVTTIVKNKPSSSEYFLPFEAFWNCDMIFSLCNQATPVLDLGTMSS